MIDWLYRLFGQRRYRRCVTVFSVDEDGVTCWPDRDGGSYGYVRIIGVNE